MGRQLLVVLKMTSEVGQAALRDFGTSMDNCPERSLDPDNSDEREKAYTRPRREEAPEHIDRYVDSQDVAAEAGTTSSWQTLVFRKPVCMTEMAHFPYIKTRLENTSSDALCVACCYFLSSWHPRERK